MFSVILPDRVIEKIVDGIELAETIKSVLISDVSAPERTAVTIGKTWFSPMLAGDKDIIAVKMVGVYPENPARGLPLVRAVTAVYDTRTGEPLLLYEANSATGIRTAAASLLAAKYMGAARGGVLGVIGAGVQGRWHGQLFKRVFEPREVLVASRTRSSAERLASVLSGRVASVEEVNRNSDILITATNSVEPVVHGEMLLDGAVVVSVGAPRPVREFDGAVARRGRCLLADTVAGVISESPDAEGWEQIVGLEELVKGGKCDWGEIRVYKSVGTSLFDLAISKYITRKLGLLGSNQGL